MSATNRPSRLSPAQRSALTKYRRYWERVSRSTKPADRPQAERWMDRAYEIAGLPPPRAKIWVPSPLIGAIASHLLANAGQPPPPPGSLPLWGEFEPRVWDLINAQTGAADFDLPFRRVRQEVYNGVLCRASEQMARAIDPVDLSVMAKCEWGGTESPVQKSMCEHIRTSVNRIAGERANENYRERVRRVIGDRLWLLVGDARVWDQIWSIASNGALHVFRDTLLDFPSVVEDSDVWLEVRERFRDFDWEREIDMSWRYEVGECIYGCHDSLWLGFCQFLHEQCGVEGADCLEGLIGLAKTCGCWWPFDQIVVMSERPQRLQLNEQGQLHSVDDGPALQFAGEDGIWAWNGTTMSRDRYLAQIHASLARIRRERNVMRRRMLIRAYGEERYIRDSKALKIHEDEWGELYRVLLPDDEPLVMVKVRNATAEPDGSYRYYYLRVPPTITTAREAVAWTFGLRPEKYTPEVET
ncbi:MAG: hypothetical protein N3D11_11865 [Candidatus Sumerlaeia bacterium]|nr:hypothetical protein [Candidatus Sumerlaeia bacterium]